MTGLSILSRVKERNAGGGEIIRNRLPLEIKTIGTEDHIHLFSGRAAVNTARKEDLIETKVTHEVLGELYSVQDPIWRLVPDVERNVLLAALKRFCPQPELQTLLTKPYEHRPKRLKESSAFELHVSWVLGACGLSVVVLGEYEKLLAEQTSVERASVDILAAGPKRNNLLVTACTIGHPKPEDFTNLAHACEILRREVFPDTSVAVLPIVFTGAVGVRSYEEIEDGFGAVPIVDADRLGIVLELLELGLERFFFDFIGNPQLCELRCPNEELQ
jgi:hypothetical protein